MATLRIGSRSIELSNEDKPLFPDAGLTKGEVIDYYRDMAEAILRHGADRVITMQRFPDGIGKKGFIQQARADYFPDWIKGARLERVGEKGGKVEHVVLRHQADIVYLANQAVITFHGWLSRMKKVSRPDRLIFDLDPPHGDDFDAVVSGARRVRDLMKQLGMTPYVMTTGSRGVHVVAPLDAGAEFDDVRDFARAMADRLAARFPNELTVAQRKNKRRGRLYLDVMRNSWGQTAVLPYSLRAKPGAPVAAPLDWSELGRVGPQSYHLGNVRRRLGAKDDPWADIDRHRCGLGPAREKLEKLAKKEEKNDD
ncbi:MAG TPA: non-homologous end-joining DNA ligase [Pelomicrobium sp.]|nr:non-homologous end-joining DNA ligase [Pelomicrobium sp.]